MDQILFLQKKLVKWEKALEKFPHQNIYDFDNVDKRLIGGADGPVTHNLQEENTSNVNRDQLDTTIIESGGNPELNRRNHQQTAECEVDKIFKNTLQNIQEVSSHLMNLAETHEHELKTLFTAILTKFKRFVDIIQEQLSITKNTLNTQQLILSKKFLELQTKNSELIQITNELAKCREEALKPTVNEPQLPIQISTTSSQTLQKINGPVAHISKETIVHTTSPQTMTILAVSSSYQVKDNESSREQTTSHSVIVTVEPPIEAAPNQNTDSSQQLSIQSITNPSTISNAVENSTRNLHPQLLTETHSKPLLESVVIHQSTHNPLEIPHVSSTGENVNLKIPVTSSITHTRASERLISEIHSTSQEHLSTSANLVTNIQDSNTVIQSGLSPVLIEKPSSYRPSISRMQNSEPIMNEAASSSAVKQPSQQQKKTKKNEREAQLLSKIEEICRENEKLKQDKLEYEQAVHTALYKGISSLHSEAIKILPNLPLICYQPCSMPYSCLASSVSSMLPEMIDDTKYVQAKSDMSSKRKTQLRKQSTNFECYRPTKVCSQNNMIFILPKNNLDKAHINIPQFCIDRDNFETRKTVCHNRTCNKEAFEVHKHFDTVVGNDFCKGNLQEYTEAVSYSNIINSFEVSKPQKLKRCVGFTKSNRIVKN